jgi:hypothetical protein
VRLVPEHEDALARVVERQRDRVIHGQVAERVGRGPRVHVEDQEILAAARERPADVSVRVQRHRAGLREHLRLPVGAEDVDRGEEVLAPRDVAHVRVGLRLLAGHEIDDADRGEERLVEDERMRRREQLVRHPGVVSVGGERGGLERERLAVGCLRVRVRLVGEPHVGGHGAIVEVDDRQVRVDAVGDVELAPRRGHPEAGGEPSHDDAVGHVREKAVDDGDHAVILDDHVEPARIGCVPDARPRVAADGDRGAYFRVLRVEQRDRAARAIDRRHDREVRAQGDGRDVRADLRRELGGATVDVHVADGPDVAVGRPDAAAQRIEDDARGGGVLPLRRRNDARRRGRGGRRGRRRRRRREVLVARRGERREAPQDDASPGCGGGRAHGPAP